MATTQAPNPTSETTSTGAQKKSRAQLRFERWNERNIRALGQEVNRLIREGEYEAAAEIGLALIEGFQGTLRLTASAKRLERATYALVFLTGVLIVFTFLLWRGHL